MMHDVFLVIPPGTTLSLTFLYENLESFQSVSWDGARYSELVQTQQQNVFCAEGLGVMLMLLDVLSLPLAVFRALQLSSDVTCTQIYIRICCNKVFY